MADPTAPSYVDSGTRGKIHSRCQGWHLLPCDCMYYDHIESTWMHILSDRHSRSHFIHFNLIISLLSRISVTSSLQDFLVIHILRQQTAQDSEPNVLPLWLLNCGYCAWIAKSPYFHVLWNLYRWKKDRICSLILIYGNTTRESRIWTDFLASPDLEQSLTKTKKELWQAPMPLDTMVVLVDCFYGPVFRPHARRPLSFLDGVWVVRPSTSIGGQFLRAVRKLRAVGWKNVSDQMKKRNFACGRCGRSGEYSTLE